MKFLITALFSLSIQIVLSQSVSLNGHLIETRDNFLENADDVANKLKSSSVGQQYFILQFDEIPTVEEREYLLSKGITLLDYIQDNAYFVSATSEVSSIPKRKSENIRTLIELEPEYKINPYLIVPNIPQYAKVDGDRVRVIIQYYDYADPTNIESLLISLGASDVLVAPVFNQVSATLKVYDIALIAEIENVQNIAPISPPMEPTNSNSRSLHGASAVSGTVPSVGYNLTGKDIYVGLWDLDCEHHRDVSDRLIIKEEEWRASSHGMHTGGTIAGAGVMNPKMKGMAPDATLVAWNFNWQSNRLNESAERLLSLDEFQTEITSNSWGYSVSRCPNSFSYGSRDSREDKITQLYPYYLIVYAAGNNQSTCTDGYKTTSNNLKNALHVASTYNTGSMSWYSSYGPAYDGRIIPNITASGTYVNSCIFDQDYGSKSGTSMACPGVAGTMALLYQRYKDTHEGQRPISSLMRALACNSATDMGNAGPDYKFGYGMINAVKALVPLENNQFFTDSIIPYQSYEYNIEVPEGAADLRVMLAWNDKEGTTNSKRSLINDLDLIIENEDSIILPWVLDADAPSLTATRATDNLNNMEQVTIDEPTAGTYTIRVEGTAVASDAQEFALVYEINTPNISFTYPVGNESLTTNENVLIHWLCDAYDEDYTLEYSIDGGKNYSVIASDIASDQLNYNWKIPDVRSAQVKLRLSNNLTYVETPQPFNIMPVPQNVSTEAKPSTDDDPYVLNWDKLDSAKYEILKVNGNKYELIGESDYNTSIVAKPSNDDNDWYTVRAIDITSGAVSERSIAVKLNTASTEAITSPYTIDFNDQNDNDVKLYSNKGSAMLKYITKVDAYGIMLEGNSSNSDWVNSTDGEACFNNNPSYISTLTLGNIQANSAQNELELSFDFRQKLTEENSSFFRVKINDIVVPNTSGDTIYSQEVVSYQKVCYNLSEYVDDSSIKVEIEAVCKSNYSPYKTSSGSLSYTNDNYDTGDFVAIDNIKLTEEAQIGIILDTIITTDNFTDNENITITIRNNSSCEVTDIPVNLTINNDTVAKEVIDVVIAPFTSFDYEFETSANLSEKQLYTITAAVDYPHNEDPDRCDFTINKANNGTDLLMNSVDSINMCDGTFTDDGGQFLNYTNANDSWITISPEQGKNCQVAFSEFSLESDSDVLSIYSGNDMNKVFVGSYSGSEAPPTITSDAPLGELTFHFQSNSTITNTGWVSTVECVDKPLYEMRIDSIVSPTSTGIKTSEAQLTIRVSNSGSSDLVDIPLEVFIDDQIILYDTLPLLEAMSSLEFTFDSTLDISVVKDYKVMVQAIVTEDATTANNESTKNIRTEDPENNLAVVDIEMVPRRENSSPMVIDVINKGNTILSDWHLILSKDGGVVMDETIEEEILPGQTLQIIPEFEINLSDSIQSTLVEVYIELDDDVDTTDNYWSKQMISKGNYDMNVNGNFVANSFNGIVSHIISPYSLENDFTIECWVKLEDPVSFGTIFEKGSISLKYHHSCEISSEYEESNTSSLLYEPNSYILKVETDQGVFVQYIPNSVTFGEWQHIALSVSSTNTYTFYINGVAQQWEVVYGEVNKVQENNLAPLHIGNSLYRDESMNGSIDEFRIWDHYREQDIIAENMMTNYASDYAGILAYYKFIENGGNYIFDYSAYDNTAEVSSALTDSVGKEIFWQIPLLFEEFHIDNELAPSCYDSIDERYEIVLEDEALTDITAYFKANMQSEVYVDDQLQESGVTQNDFTNSSLIYTVQGIGFNSNVRKNYECEVRNRGIKDATELMSLYFEPENNAKLKDTLSLTHLGNNYYKKVEASLDPDSLIASFELSPGAKLYINNTLQSSPQTQTIDYSQPIIAKVISENNKFESCYSILIDNKNTESKITSFSILNGQVGNTLIDTINNTITVWIAKDIDPSWLTPEYSISKNGVLSFDFISQVSGVTGHNFESSVIYKVTSEDGTSSTEWTINVIPDVNKPSIDLIGDSVMHVSSEDDFQDPGATALDDVSGDISDQITTTISSSTRYYNYYYIEYQVSDEAGNASDTIMRKVIIDKLDRRYNTELKAVEGKIYTFIKEVTSNSSIAIFTLNGDKIYDTELIVAGEQVLDIDIPQGLYIVKLNSENNNLVRMLPLY